MSTQFYLPEGYDPPAAAPLPLSAIQALIDQQTIVEGTVVRCDPQHRLYIRFRGYDAYIPREEAVHPAISGAQREISILSRVGKTVSFLITGCTVDGGGKPMLILSRRLAQEIALRELLERAVPGTVLRGKITHLERFGAFVDIGCGVIALLPLEYISVARIPHPQARFSEDQKVLVAVKQVDRSAKRFTLTHKELLGSWMENASLFLPGETVPGIVRGIKPYGVFVELTPNLSGLAEPWEGLEDGDSVSVFIKSIRPEQMKIKLQIVQRLPTPPPAEPLSYWLTGGVLEKWVYSPPGYLRGEEIATTFLPAPGIEPSNGDR